MPPHNNNPVTTQKVIKSPNRKEGKLNEVKSRAERIKEILGMNTRGV